VSVKVNTVSFIRGRRAGSERPVLRGATDPPLPALDAATPGAAAGPTSAPGETGPDAALRWYVARVRVTDMVAIITAVGLAQLVRFGQEDWDSALGGSVVVYSAMSTVLALLWFGCLALQHAADPRIVGRGVEEYQRVAVATVRLFGAIAVLSLLSGIPIARGYLAIALPVGLVGCLAGRHLNRRILVKRWEAGDSVSRVLILGSWESAVGTVQCFTRNKSCGFAVVGVCIPDLGDRDAEAIVAGDTEVPILGDHTQVLQAIKRYAADTVIVTASDRMGHQRMRNLGWDLHGKGIDLIVVPGVADVAGPRLRIQPIAGLPLLHVDEPRYEGAVKWGKATFDRVGAFLGLVVVLPVFLVVALLIMVGDGRPVFYRQVRVGQDGREFRMWKFRSMVRDADSRLEQVRAEVGATGTAFFKAEADPRITPIGRVLRSTSIDELPQLLNVLTGEMSLVGPRPLVKGEGAGIEGFVERRILVRPGMTGLWQVSGRSCVSEDARVSLDLSYVENWSILQDLLIIARTVRVVMKRGGAY
jgi:exopolysaccharide biosynthesis polyprenyl glycosylphosphotransferase